jgi:hypothetical protein
MRGKLVVLGLIALGVLAHASPTHAALVTIGFNARVENLQGRTDVPVGTLFSGTFTIDPNAPDLTNTVPLPDPDGLFVLPEVRLYFNGTEYVYAPNETELQINLQTFDSFIVRGSGSPTGLFPVRPDLFLRAEFPQGTLPNAGPVQDIATLNSPIRYPFVPAGGGTSITVQFVNGPTFNASLGSFFLLPEPRDALLLALAALLVGAVRMQLARA